MKIEMRATYEEIWWSDDEDDEEPFREGGFTDPDNPWGGFQIELPPSICGDEARQWMDENAKTVTFDTMWEAAEFVVDFPGAVWDFVDDCDASQDMHTGHYVTVTLHVENHQEGVFAIAEFIQAQQDKHLRELREVRA